MIVQLFPNTAWRQLSLIAAEQDAYYSQHNAHVVAFYRAALQ
jgi:hypothetical protein